MATDSPPNLGSNQPGEVPSKFEFNALLAVVLAVQVILVVCIVTLVWTAFNNSQATFQDLKDKVTAQNAKIDLLIQEYGKK